MPTTVYGAGRTTQGIGLADSVATVQNSTVAFANGAGMSFGLNGSTMTASGPGGAGGGPALAAGTQTATGGTVVFANSNGITFGMSGSSQVTAGNVPVLNYYDNLPPRDGTSVFTFSQGPTDKRVSFFPLHPCDPVFPGNMTVNTMLVDVSFAAYGTINSSSFKYNFGIGIYTVSSDSFSMLNSCSTSWGTSGHTSLTAAQSYNAGPRFISIHSSQWSASPTFTEGGFYVMAISRSSISSNGIPTPINQQGTFYVNVYPGSVGAGVFRSGTFGASDAGVKFYPYIGSFVGTTAAFPASFATSDAANNNQFIVPRVVLNNNVSAF